MYISNMSKDELEKLMLDHFLHPFLEVKESPIHGKGVFAKIDLPTGQIFEMHKLTTFAVNPELRRYVWEPSTISGGLGYFANGSCPYFAANSGKKFGPYVAVPFNIVYRRKEEVFQVLKPIRQGEELILDYSDPYFFVVNQKTGKLDYSKLVV